MEIGSAGGLAMFIHFSVTEWIKSKMNIWLKEKGQKRDVPAKKRSQKVLFYDLKIYYFLIYCRKKSSIKHNVSGHFPFAPFIFHVKYSKDIIVLFFSIFLYSLMN